jgi:uroporphyrinogen-III decarboxylase
VGLLVHPFFFRLGLYTLGLEPFLQSFYDDPGLIQDMFSFWADFTVTLTGRIMSEIKPDFVVIAEDMAHKTGPHISPQMYHEFWSPHQGQVIECFRKAGIKVISFWNSGNLMALLPAIVDAGFNCMWPLEDLAGMKAATVWERYGKSMRMVGNVAKESLIAGKEAIKREVYEKVPPLLESGGYIPAIDDQTPLEVSFDSYTYYLDLLRQIGREMGLPA